MLRFDPDDPGNRRISPLCQPREWPRPWPERRSSTAPRRAAGGWSSSRPTGGSSRSTRCSTASTTTSPAISWSTAGTDSVSPIRAIRSIPFGPAIFPLSRPLLGAAPGAQRPPRLGRPRASPTTPFHPARCCCRRTRRRSTWRTANRAGSAARAARLSRRVTTAARSPRVLHTFGADHRGASPRHRRDVPRCGGQHRRLRRLAAQRTRAADLCVLAARRGDREPSVPRRQPQRAVSAAAILIRFTSRPAAASSIARRPPDVREDANAQRRGVS